LANRRVKHSAVFARELVEVLAAQGHDTGALLAEVGLEPGEFAGESARIPFAPMAALFERAAELTGDDLLGLHRGAVRDNRHAGLIAYVGLTAPTVSQYIANLARYRRVYSEALEMDVSALDKAGTVTWRFEAGPQVARRQMLEFAASGVVGELRNVTGTALCPSRVAFRHRRRGGTDEIEAFFGCPVVFGQPTNRMDFDSPTLALPLRTRDDELLKILQSYCEETLAKLPGPEASTRADVERAIAGMIASGELSQKRIAEALAMTPRTLTRKLAAEGTSFSEVLRAYRLESALTYLQRTDLPLLQIAYLLGYEESSSFSTAFRRWAGRSPKTVRREAVEA